MPGPLPWATPPAAWAASTNYSATAPASVVTFAGGSYVCSTTHTSGTSFDATKWILIAAPIGVTSFNSRINAVVPANGDYTFAQIGGTPTTLAGYGITDAQPALGYTPVQQGTGVGQGANVIKIGGTSGGDLSRPPWMPPTLVRCGLIIHRRGYWSLSAIKNCPAV